MILLILLSIGGIGKYADANEDYIDISTLNSS